MSSSVKFVKFVMCMNESGVIFFNQVRSNVTKFVKYKNTLNSSISPIESQNGNFNVVNFVRSSILAIAGKKLLDDHFDELKLTYI